MEHLEAAHEFLANLVLAHDSDQGGT
jgi:hypothetical protein